MNADPALIVHPDGGRSVPLAVFHRAEEAPTPRMRLSLTPCGPGRMAFMISCSDAAARSVVVEYATAGSTSVQVGLWIAVRAVNRTARFYHRSASSTSRILGSPPWEPGKLEHAPKTAGSPHSDAIRRPESPSNKFSRVLKIAVGRRVADRIGPSLAMGFSHGRKGSATGHHADGGHARRSGTTTPFHPTHQAHDGPGPVPAFSHLNTLLGRVSRWQA